MVGGVVESIWKCIDLLLLNLNAKSLVPQRHDLIARWWEASDHVNRRDGSTSVQANLQSLDVLEVRPDGGGPTIAATWCHVSHGVPGSDLRTRATYSRLQQHTCPSAAQCPASERCGFPLGRCLEGEDDVSPVDDQHLTFNGVAVPKSFHA